MYLGIPIVNDELRKNCGRAPSGIFAPFTFNWLGSSCYSGKPLSSEMGARTDRVEDRELGGFS